MKKMIATVHSGHLGRWFEQLCRIRWDPIRKLADNAGERIEPQKLPDRSAVYVFWWTGELYMLSEAVQDRYLILRGPGGRSVKLAFNKEWLGIEAGVPVPLYVGKTAAGLHKRIPQHLMLARKRILPMGKKRRRQSDRRPVASSAQVSNISFPMSRTHGNWC